MSKNNKIVAPNDGKPMFAIMLTLLLLISVVTIGLIVFKENDKGAWSTEKTAYDVEDLKVEYKEDDNEGAYVSFYTNKDAENTIGIFSDPRCPVCKTFEEQAGEGISKKLTEGNTKVKINLLTFLDDMTNSQYSKDATTVFIKLAQAGEAEAAWQFYNTMWNNQPAERRGADVPELGEIAQTASHFGAKKETIEDIKKTDSVKFGENINKKNIKVLEDATGEVSTPTIFYNGVHQQQAMDPDWINNL